MKTFKDTDELNYGEQEQLTFLENMVCTCEELAFSDDTKEEDKQKFLTDLTYYEKKLEDYKKQIGI